MPQMSPLNWILLYPYFLILFYFFIIMIYFLNYTYKTSSHTSNNSTLSKDWKW